MTMPKSQLRFRGKNISKNLILKICPKFFQPQRQTACHKYLQTLICRRFNFLLITKFERKSLPYNDNYLYYLKQIP